MADGFINTISYGNIGYVVPHSLYPDGYHCKPKEPLPFISIASQKNSVSNPSLGDLCEHFIGRMARKRISKLQYNKD